MPATRCPAATSAVCARPTSSGGISRTTSVSPASTRSTRWCSAAATICPARDRFSAAGAPTGCCRSTAVRRRRSTARWRADPALGCYALIVGDPYAGAHDVNQFYNPAAFADPKPVATIGQTDFSPLGGPRSQVTGPPLRQTRHGHRAADSASRGDAASRFASKLQPHESPGIQCAGESVLNFHDRETSRA